MNTNPKFQDGVVSFAGPHPGQSLALRRLMLARRYASTSAGVRVLRGAGVT